MAPPSFRVTVALAVLAAACDSTDSDSTTIINLDRPVDVAFACFGGLRLVGDNGVADLDDAIISSPQSMEACRLYALEERERAPGQENLDDQDPVPQVDYYGFILQSVPGTVALALFPAVHPDDLTLVDVNIFDADPLTPGKNAVAVGDLPIGIAADPAGCHMVTANAGSCDLSVIEVAGIVDDDPETDPVVRAVDLVNSRGEPVVARPAAIEATPIDRQIGAACPATPEGLVWVALPDCHLVAAVRIGTGQIEAAVRFTESGLVELTDGDVACPAQCGESDATITAGERPVAIDLVRDDRVSTTRMVIGADNSAFLTMVELDDRSLPLSLSRVELSGEIGVEALALSPQIGMGGSSGVINDESGAGGQFQFVYAVATDGTVRVADVLGAMSECDTQVDPRYLRGTLTTVDQACYPVGAPTTPPRRPLARGPGIELLDDAFPTGVAIVRNDGDGSTQEVLPDNLIGTFAYISDSSGDVSIVNIDDDNYSDAWLPAAPIERFIPLIISHQLRDAVEDRDRLATTEEDGIGLFNCTDRGGYSNSSDLLQGGPRLTASTDLSVLDYVGDADRLYARPGPHRVECYDEVEEETTSVYEMHFAAPQDIRDATFPDLRAVRVDETWTMSWEGLLSLDGFDEAIDGPAERVGLVDVGDGMRLDDPSRPFCAMGVEPYDWVELTGCDPDVGDDDCGLGLVCYVHPDAEVGSGQCLPEDTADDLASTCRDFLLTIRRYGVTTTSAGELTLVPRRRVLSTSPLSGCTSNQQCDELAWEAALLADDSDDGVHPKDFVPTGDLGTYSCRQDPSRAPGPSRCVRVCDGDDACGAGATCVNNECVEGVIPPAECLGVAERYAVHASEAYAVIGNVNGFVHDIVEDPATGACVAAPGASPLLTGRLPLTAPPCSGDGFTDLAPNPCTTTVADAQKVPVYDDDCEEVDDQLVIEDVPAIRFRNPAFTFHLVRPTYPGDARCREDRAGGLVDVPYAREGHTMYLRVVTGFYPLRPGISAIFPIKVVRGPEDSVWVIDHGDDIPDDSDTTSTRGQVIRLEPGVFSTINVVR